MGRHKKDDPKRQSRRTSWHLRLSFLTIGFLLGVACAELIISISQKADLMMGRSEISRIATLADTAFYLGLDHLRSCETKVKELHDLLALATPGEVSEGVALNVASILIDGNNCNKYLVNHLESQRKLPAIPFLGGFDGIEIPGMDIAPPLDDEQGLILWMLHRISPEERLFSPEYYAICEESREHARANLVMSWKYLYGE